MKLLLAVDGSKYSKKALAFLLANRDRLLASERADHAALHVINVQVPIPPRAQNAVGSEIVKKYHEEESSKVLKPVCKFLDSHDIPYTSEWRAGHPAEEIVAAAKRRKSHMIVMGTHGRGALGRVLMGSVAQNVVAESNVPVLLIK
jgi:nucleotide-binding universal stress UspA family protein